MTAGVAVMPHDSAAARAGERLRDGARELGVELDAGQIAQLGRFLAELERWNARLNLVGEHDRERLIGRHLLDSLAAVPLLAALGSELRIADFGSGAGLPGIPLAIALAPREMMLIEPRRKRASFLRAVRRLLPDLALMVVEGRADELATAGARQPGSFDAIVSRAALTDEELLRTAGVLLREGGLLVAYRGTEQRDTSDSGPPGDAAFSPRRVVPYRLAEPGRSFNLVLWQRSGFT